MDKNNSNIRNKKCNKLENNKNNKALKFIKCTEK